MFTKRKIQILVSLIVAVALVFVIVAVSGGKKSSTPSSTSGAPKGTLTFAEAPGAAPNYIFPYMSCKFFSVANINQFQQEMYRPLYWFGLGGSSAYVPSLSLADRPVFSNADKTITINLKGWKFANGQSVDARSVMFFLNMYRADPTSYCGYNGGFGIPDQLKSATASDNTVVLHFTTSVNPGWILYNYLSEITPMSHSWDRTSATTTSTCDSGTYGAASTKVACKAVEHYLAGLSSKTSTYPSSLWQGGVDGPWKLTSLDSIGNASFVPNRAYSGPQKAQVATVKLVAYTATQAEMNDLQAGKVDLGYIDTTVLTASATSPGTVGPNWRALATRYNIITGPQWNFNYAPFNFSTADPKYAAISQLYIRQALQLAVDQNGIIRNVDKGYGFPISSPLPPNTASSISGPVKDPYPFNMTQAKSLLTSHGWTEVNGLQTCTRPGVGAGQCGRGITKGYTLNFKIIWASGSPSLDQTFAAEVSDWNAIGIKFTHSTAPFNSVISNCSNGSGYEICSWGGGWTYAPDYYPSGETLFTPAGGFNVGKYADSHMSTLVNATTFGSAKLTDYASYAAAQLPVLYQPQSFSPGEVIKTLKSTIGFTPNPLANFMPEYYHF